MARHPTPPARHAGRRGGTGGPAGLERLTPYLPLADRDRCGYWYQACACWLAAEAAVDRELTVEEQAALLDPEARQAMATEQRQAIARNLARLRAILAPT